MIILNYLNIRHTNIVYRVKTCYKIKIGFRDLSCCFCVVLLHLWHPDLSIQPLLHSNSNPIRVKERLYCMTREAILECKSGSIAAQRCLFCSVIHCILTLTDFTLHFSCCFTNLLHSHFVSLLNNFTMQEKCYWNALHIRFNMQSYI